MGHLVHPRYGLTEILLKRPDGTVQAYQPLARHCADAVSKDETDTPPEVVRDSAYVGCSANGLNFDWPGAYIVVAVHHCLDGSVLVSNRVTVRVLPPVSRRDDATAALFLEHETRVQLALLGSDSESLRRGRHNLQTAVEEHPNHPLTGFAHMVLGMGLARPFKTVQPRGVRYSERPAKGTDAAAHLDSFLDRAIHPATTQRPLDGMSLVMVLRERVRLAREADGPNAPTERNLRVRAQRHFRRRGAPSAGMHAIFRSTSREEKGGES